MILGNNVKLISKGQEIEGRQVKVPNSVAIANNGDIFWSDSSTEFELLDGVYDILADGSGRYVFSFCFHNLFSVKQVNSVGDRSKNYKKCR